MFEGADESLHIEPGVGFVVAEIGETDFDFIAEFGGFFFGFFDLGFESVGKFDFGGGIIGATFGGTEKGPGDFGDPSPIYAEDFDGLVAGFNFLNPFVGGVFVPVVRDRTSKDLDPHFFGFVGVEFGEGAGNAGEGVDFEIFERADGEDFIFGKGDFGAVSDLMGGSSGIDVIFGNFFDLDARVLGVDLAFDKVTEDFRGPDIEADLATGGDDFEGEVFLGATGIFELFGVAEDAMEGGEKLFGGEFFFVVGAGDFEEENDGVDIEDFDLVEFFVVAVGEKAENSDDGNPDYRHKNKVDDIS